jgi:predicted nucleic acid-binding protein
MNPHAYLLDVNVLISLVDPMHVHHRRAMDWFSAPGSSNWLTCPTTQNGTIRISSGPKYSQNGFTPSMVIEVVRNLIDVGNHPFVPDNISLLDANHINAEGLRRGSQVTDSYLLGTMRPGPNTHSGGC